MAGTKVVKFPGPFKRVSNYGDGIGINEGEIVCEAEFELPNDGTPDTRNLLVVRVAWMPDSTEANVRLISRVFTERTREKLITSQNVIIEKLGDLLYGYATLKTQQILVPR